VLLSSRGLLTPFAYPETERRERERLEREREAGERERLEREREAEAARVLVPCQRESVQRVFSDRGREGSVC
jgi:hypothetical protein